MDEVASKKVDIDEVLSGTTLRVYTFMVKRGVPIGPRELQRLMGFSSPSLATFHLEKLVKAGLVSDSENGLFSIEKTYLRHYIRIRRHLIPRYAFYALLSTLFVFGWIVIMFIPSGAGRNSFYAGLHTADSFLLLTFLLYGVVLSVTLCALFWYETIQVLKHDRI